MIKLTFLGTGPAFGVSGRGKDRRRESSALLSFGGKNILIDVSRDFGKQIAGIEKIAAVLLTHAHRDASGGMAQLATWWQARYWDKLPIYALPETLGVVRRRFKRLDFAQLVPFSNQQDLKVAGLTVVPFRVRHSLTAGFPTVGFSFHLDGKNILTYVSDVGRWNLPAQRLMSKAKCLVIDGAMWDKKMAAHQAILKVLPRICVWGNERIIFTQVGKTVPRFAEANRVVKKQCSKAELAYDGMEVVLK